MDTWTTVFLIAAVQSMFVAFALLMRRQGQVLANRLLALLMGLFSITLFEYVLYWSQQIVFWPRIAHVSTHLPFLFGPILWFYIRTIYENHRFSAKDVVHLLPFLTGIILFLPWYLLDVSSKRQVLEAAMSFPVSPRTMAVLASARITSMLLYAIWARIYIRRQPALGLTAKWAVALVLFFIGFALAYWSYFIMVRFPWFDSQWDYHISAAMTAFIYLVAYAGYTQPAVFNGLSFNEIAIKPVKYQNSVLTPEAGRSLAARVKKIMEEEKLFTDSDLSLEMLAQRTGMSRHAVSQAINEHLGATFFEYINHLRIEEAKKLLQNTSREDMHIVEIAYSSGFNNKVSFNNIFKKKTGMTPTQYRSQFTQMDQSSKSTHNL
jgi:AraC-like DNA-binding protein